MSDRWTRSQCDDYANSLEVDQFSDDRLHYCLTCDHFLQDHMYLDRACTEASLQEYFSGLTETGTPQTIIDDLYEYNNDSLQNYKELFRNDTLLDAIRTELPNTEYPEDHILTRTIGQDTVETSESLLNYEERRQKCNALKCGEDCKNDDDCYWNVPFYILNDTGMLLSSQSCSCEPNIFLNSDSIFGKESLQERLADEFYNIYSKELQVNCNLSQGDNPFKAELLANVENHSQYCLDLDRTTLISEAIYSSSSDSNVMNIYEKCIDMEGNHRENILKQCLSKPLIICNDENDQNKDCIQLDISYYDLISDIFGYYVLRNTSYENPDRCECNLLTITDTGPPYYSFNEKEYLLRSNCEETTSGIPRGICAHNMPIVQKYLDANESQIIDGDSSREHMRGILNKNKCERTNSIKHNNIDYFHSRLFCDPINNYRTEINSDIEQMITNNLYEEVNDYNIRDGQEQTIPDNNLRIWDSVNGQYTNEMDFNKSNCISNIHRCMGFEPVKTESEYYNDLYEMVLDSHYFLLPLDVGHETRRLGYLRSFSALNNHYMGDLSFDFPYGTLYGYMIEQTHNIFSNTTDENITILEDQYYIAQTVKQGGRISPVVRDNQSGSGMESIDRIELAETLQTVYRIDYLNSIRDYTIIALLLVCSAIFLYFYSLVILFVHIPWIIIYIIYIKIKEYFSQK